MRTLYGYDELDDRTMDYYLRKARQERAEAVSQFFRGAADQVRKIFSSHAETTAEPQRC